ncbi:MAG: hypothetical protein WEA54_01765 [Actinomycetota bacterium]
MSPEANGHEEHRANGAPEAERPAPRYELPEALTPDEERVTLAALERYLHGEARRPPAWCLAGRIESTGQGALQTRRLMDAPWGAPTRLAFARRGSVSLWGRADVR